MKTLKWLLACLVLASSAALAQSPTRLCIPTGVGNSCQVIDSTNPLPTTPQATGSAASQVTSVPTIQAAAYVAGDCVGGFNAVTVATTDGQSGLLYDFSAANSAGGVVGLVVYAFSSNPSASTCTDKTQFVLGAADVNKIILSPQAFTMTTIGPLTTTTFSSTAYYTTFVAGGSSSSGVKTIYYALVAASPFTPTTTSDLKVRIGVGLN